MAAQELSEALQILEKVDTFYSTSFGHLITVTGGALAFVGVLVPWFIGWQQDRRFKTEQATQEAWLKQAVDNAKKELREGAENDAKAIRAEAEQKLQALRLELTGQIQMAQHKSEAAAFHLQARQQLQDSLYIAAFESAISATRLYAKCGDELNLSAGLHIAMKSIAKVTKTDFDAHDDLVEDVQGLCDHLEHLSKGNGRYTREIAALKRAFADAKTRMPTAS